MDRLPAALAWIGIIATLAIASLGAQPTTDTTALAATGGTALDEPITPLPEPPAADPLKLALGEHLFSDNRLSSENLRSCATCHDVSQNGASGRIRDTTPDGESLSFNTTTVFNAALNFRLGWEGKYRTLETQIEALLQNPLIMGCSSADAAAKLRLDPDMVRDFEAAYGHEPDSASLLNALATFERSLITTGSRFDRWLQGDTTALSDQEVEGYHLFKSLGCIACHQGMNVGGNLFERQGVFHPLARPDPQILRVPSLRNVATTAPYFHDGSAASLQEAVRKMGLGQLNSTLTDPQIEAIVAYLQTLTGSYRGRPIGGP